MTHETIWVTGATGFVGGALVARLQAEELAVRPVSRSAAKVQGLDACAPTELGNLLAPGDVMVYAAGRAHVRGTPDEASRAAFRQANCDEPLAIARLAVSRGARRFVFISSIKVNGERTEGVPFSDVDVPHPEDEYGHSKWEGEQALWRLSQETGLELVIVRPPLVYGPGVKANFATMMRWLQRGFPLPLASVSNKRSLIYLENLVDLLVLCCRHPAAADEVILASDGQDVSTPQLLQLLGEAMGRPAHLWSCPVPVLKFGASLLGRAAMAERLCDSLQVSSALARNRLMWRAPFSVEEGLRETARWFVGGR